MQICNYNIFIFFCTALICQSRQLDLVFVLDNSSYVGMEDWQTMVSFMIDILDRLPTGQQDVRIGMVTFADTAKSDVYLDGFTDRESLINALRGARQAKYIYFRPVYTKRQSQCSFNPAMMLAIQLSLKSMETNKVAPEWGCNPFWRDSIVVNESCVPSVIAALTLH